MNKGDRLIRLTEAFTAAAAVLTLGLMAVSDYERYHPEYAYYRITDRKLTGRKRIVFLTDLHEHDFGDDNALLIDMIDRAGPDMVLIGGDMPMVKKASAAEVSLSLIKRLAEKYTVYYGDGNHETRLRMRSGGSSDGCSYERALKKLGVVRLINDSIDIEGGITITGLTLEESAYRGPFSKGPTQEELLKKAGSADRNRYNILLAHSPLYEREYARWGADLTLAGHFHGGTVRLPGDIGLMTPQYQFFSRYVHGERICGAMHMIISAGLGTHSVNLRVNDTPEVVVTDLIPDGDDGGTGTP